MPARKPAKSRRPVPAPDPLRRLLVKYDERGDPVCDDDGRPIFWVIDEGGQLRRLVFPIQPDDEDDKRRQRRPFGAGGGPPDDLPAPLKITTGRRGQPPKTPAGTWEDDGLIKQVADCLMGPDKIGTLRDREYYADDAEVVNNTLDRLFLLAEHVLGHPPTREEKADLKRFAFGGTGKRSGIRKRAESAYDIARYLLERRHRLTAPAVRRMLSRKPNVYDFTALVLKYEAERPLLDETGKPVRYDADGKLTTDDNGRPIIVVRPPICDEDGRPILWVPDEHGQPSRAYGVLDEHGQLQPFAAGEPLPRRRVKAVRPPVKMIFR